MGETACAVPAATQRRRVLVVDDDPQIVELVRFWLEGAGYDVATASDGREALVEVDRQAPDLIVLDVMMPNLSGLDVLRAVSGRAGVRIILLTARGMENDRVLGLAMGADDYVVKPFSLVELVERVKAVLRRSPVLAADSAPRTLNLIRVGDLTVDSESREVWRSGLPVELTTKEYDLLAFLLASPGKVFTRAQLLRDVWESAPEWQDTATVTEHIHRLRQKIEPDPANPSRLLTVRGGGYRFERRNRPRD